ncbi:MAG: 2-hydroxyacid dehydrogenase [Boseongicola sp. SB0677_bin_26]|nr:2-hydroxyacid dehydrogenase [Boseongicola sp. SB0665_bin_10]MYG25784.1 2-hydroxyacid dehydrogenase [Boseongicola sp. SB0677_bin_26]
MPKPEILRVGPYPERDQVPLDQPHTVLRYFKMAVPASFLNECGRAIRGIATRDELGADRKMTGAFPNLEINSVYEVGYDAVDLDSCRERSVRVTSAPDVLTCDVADLGVAMLPCQARGMIAADAWMRGGDRAREDLRPPKRRVHWARAGVLGLGRVGRQVARRLAGLDMEIAHTDLAPRDCTQDRAFIADPVELARHSDYLFVALAASDEIRRFVGREVVEAVGPEGTVINIRRASHIGEAALLNALESGALGCVVLDVFEGEPELSPRFLKPESVRLQPRHASGTVETRKAMGKLVRDNLAAHFSGRPLLTPAQ